LYEVEVRQDGTVAVAGRVIASSRTHAGEIRAGGRTVWAAADGDVRWVFVDGQVYRFEVQRRNAATRRRARHDGGLSAPMPATVIRIPVRIGDRVRAGDVVLILEAMKMELPIRATVDGTVTAVRCREGELVQPGEDLIDISSAEKG
jgi:acetyl/propionyl-CoA carboxylase alpha subunit